MFKRSRAVHTALAMLLTLFLLAACGGEEPAETEASPTTGDTGAFEISGTVTEVEIESDEDEATPTASPTGTASPTDADSPTASPTGTPTGPLARLLVEVESINAGPAELCDVNEGDEVTIIVTEDTVIDPDQELEELEEIEGRSVTAEGNAEEIDLEEGATPSPTDTEASPEATGTATATGSPTATPTDGADDDQRCNFEVVRLTVQEEDDGEGATPATGTGTATGSPTPAPAGGGDVPGGTTPTPTGSPTTPGTPTGASPTPGGAGS